MKKTEDKGTTDAAENQIEAQAADMVTQCRIVEFYPSKRTAQKLHRPGKDVFVAIITHVNDETVELKVMAGANDHFFPRVPHESKAEPGHSFWNWPKRS